MVKGPIDRLDTFKTFRWFGLFQLLQALGEPVAMRRGFYIDVFFKIADAIDHDV